MAIIGSVELYSIYGNHWQCWAIAIIGSVGLLHLWQSPAVVSAPSRSSLPYLHHTLQSDLSQGSGDAITASVATANHDDILVLGRDVRVVISMLLFLPGFQEVHCIVDTFQLTT